MSSVSFGSENAGRVIDGRFPLLRKLGETERSSVYLTELAGDPAQKAVIKIVPAAAVSPAACLAQWEAAGKLSHPRLARLLHFGRCRADGEDLLYVVTEYAGEMLSEVLPARPLTPPETREMLGPVLEALAYLHGKGLVHGQLKPSNVLVIDDQVKLSVDRVHAAGEAGGIPPRFEIYDAPEAAGEKLSPAADVWSLGVLLVEALTQRPPVWDRPSGGKPTVPESLPEPLGGIARQCLQMDPARRCSLAAIQARLAPPAAAEKPAEKRPQASEERGRPPAKVRHTVRNSVALIAVVVVVLALLLGRHRNNPTAGTPTEAPATADSQSPAREAPTKPATKLSGSVVKGSVAYRAMPDVAAGARNTIRGHVHVAIRVQVDAAGSVSSAVIDAEGPSRYFAEKALAAARQWKFTPPEIGGRPAASTWILRFQFAQNGTEIDPVETEP
jgi:serine/threonine-protein kinase